MGKALLTVRSSTVKDRTECFIDDCFPCRKEERCKLEHVMKWLLLFVHIFTIKKLSKK